MTKLKTALLLSVATLATAYAQSNSPIKLTASTMKVTTVKAADGKTSEKLDDVSDKGVLPRDILEMSQRIENTSTTNYSKIELNQLVSDKVLYQSDRCDMASVVTTFSADPVKLDPKTGAWLNRKDMNFSAKPTKTVTVKENGANVTKTVDATPADYTALRWTLPSLKGKQVTNCAVRVQVK